MRAASLATLWAAESDVFLQVVVAKTEEGAAMAEKEKAFTPLHWIVGRDTGASSENIWAVMMGVQDAVGSFRGAMPGDGSDFGRCYRLLGHFPEWKDRLPEVAEAFPAWGPIVEAWDDLERLFDEGSPDGHRAVSEKLHELRPDCMRAAGYVQVSPGYWRKEPAKATDG